MDGGFLPLKDVAARILRSTSKALSELILLVPLYFSFKVQVGRLKLALQFEDDFGLNALTSIFTAYDETPGRSGPPAPGPSLGPRCCRRLRRHFLPGAFA
jgi:hypothetical protein